MPFILSRFVPALIMGLFCYVAYLAMDTRYEEEPPLQNFHNAQFVDIPLGVPMKHNPWIAQQKFDPKFHLHSPFETAQIPRFHDMSEPLGGENGAFTYNAQSFMESNKKRGGMHTGDDMNGIGGRDTDFGDPVYNIADGLVIYAGTPSPGWGKTVIVAHHSLDGRTLHSMYTHLSEIDVSLGKQIPRGLTVGSVGTAAGRYLAHLHLELRHCDGFSPQVGYSKHQFDRLNPHKTISTWPQSKLAAYYPSTMDVLQNGKKKACPTPRDGHAISSQVSENHAASVVEIR